MLTRIVATAAGLSAGLLFAAPSHAVPSTGSLLVPDDIAPGNYWAKPIDAYGGAVEVCASYTCDSTGMINYYLVQGRTMVVIPRHAIMVNVHDAALSPAGV